MAGSDTRARGSAAQQRSKKPLLSGFDFARGEPTITSQGLPAPPSTVSAWLYRLAIPNQPDDGQTG